MFRSLFIALFLVATPAFAETAAPRVSDCSRQDADGGRALCHELIVAAPADDVWRLFASTEGLQSWVAPLAIMDLRVGGAWETSYRPGARVGDAANIRNRVLSFLPERMLSIAVDRAPEGFPEADLVRDLWTVIEFEAVDAAQTRVRVSMLGYGEGEGYDVLYSFFSQGNAMTLQMLQRRVVTGPTDWDAQQ